MFAEPGNCLALGMDGLADNQSTQSWYQELYLLPLTETSPSLGPSHHLPPWSNPRLLASVFLDNWVSHSSFLSLPFKTDL